MTPPPCPRCAFSYDPASSLSLVQQQAANCEFCSKRLALQAEGRSGELLEPTDEYPTWRPA
jgi:hypothetical protein